MGNSWTVSEKLEKGTLYGDKLRWFTIKMENDENEIDFTLHDKNAKHTELNNFFNDIKQAQKKQRGVKEGQGSSASPIAPPLDQRVGVNTKDQPLSRRGSGAQRRQSSTGTQKTHHNRGSSNGFFASTRKMLGRPVRSAGRKASRRYHRLRR